MITTILLAMALASPPLPALKIDSAFPHVGTVKIGKPIERTFLLKSGEATKTIIIKGIKPACGCLKHSLTENTKIAPGETIEWKVTIDTMAQPAGERSWSIRYFATYENDGGIESAIKVTADLIEEIRVSPPMVAFSTTGEANQTITISDKRPGSSLTITSIEASHASLSAEKKSDGTIAVSLKSDAVADGKTYKETVVIRTTDPEYPEIRVPVSFVKNINDPVAISPAAFEIDLKRSPASLIQIRERSGSLIAIKSAESNVNGVSLAFSPAKNPVAAIKATIDPAVAGKTGSAIVTVTLADGAMRFVPVAWK